MSFCIVAFSGLGSTWRGVQIFRTGLSLLWSSCHKLNRCTVPLASVSFFHHAGLPLPTEVGEGSSIELWLWFLSFLIRINGHWWDLRRDGASSEPSPLDFFIALVLMRKQFNMNP
ncbi:unnamed protein product [Rangifer tarandus platyrhynchus]|uniref:Uncharacterized protein n=1 Tax=Rangifer tarandus platyrhynchus TaxID=3082113 RepID=A0ABN8Z1J8_RANTA|nr:unnamed protein product [Rangifer tarandus platyrhynchus]